MRRLLPPPAGLIGRIFAILLLTVLIEFGFSTLFYERASQFSVREDEARRLAEHLVVARKLLTELPPPRRTDMAAELTTNRYEVRWERTLPTLPRFAPPLDRMHDRIVAWEPSLASADLQLRLNSPGRNAVIVGGLRLPDRSWLYFRTREPLQGIDLALGRILLSLTPAVALILLGGLLVRETLLPMRRLAQAADRIGSGNGSVEVPEVGTGEVRRVIAAFNRMQDRIHRLIVDRTQALAAVGHDLRTPLARLRLRADAVQDRQVREAIENDVAEMESMVGSLLAYLGGEDEPEKPAFIDLAVLCATLVDDAADRGGTASYDGPDHLELMVRPVGLKRALVNLVENALHYADAVRLSIAAEPSRIVIRVDDNGPGIPESEIDKVLQPFVRLDSARSRNTFGFGLGLPIVVRAVEAEGGTLRLANRPEGGLRAEICLPRTAR